MQMKKIVTILLCAVMVFASIPISGIDTDAQTVGSGESQAKLKLLTGYDYDDIFINTDGILAAEKNGNDYGQNGDYGILSEDGVWTQDDSISKENPKENHTAKYNFKSITDQSLIESFKCLELHNEVTPCNHLFSTLKVANIYDYEKQEIVDDTDYIGPGDGFGGPDITTIDNLEYQYYLGGYPTENYVDFYLKNSDGKWGVKNMDTGAWVVEQKYDTFEKVKAAYQFYQNPNQTVYSIEYTIVNSRPVFNVYKYTSPTNRYRASVDFTLVSDFDRYQSLGSYVVASTYPAGISSEVDEGAIRTQKILDLNGNVVATLGEDENIFPYNDQLTDSLFRVHNLDTGKYALATIEGSVSSTESTVDTSSGIEIEASTGIIPDGAQLNVNKIESGNNFVMVQGALGDTVNQFTLFDISLLKDNSKVQPNGKIKITIPIPEGYNKDNLAIYYVSDDGKVTEMTSTVDGSNISFETDHFSYYVLAEKAATATGVSTNTPKTGDMTNVLPLAMLMLISAGVMALVYRRKNINRKMN
jgi:LPXTG-motif cell wall-anchored protein